MHKKKLNDKCLNPLAIEKSEMSFATGIFSESTRNAMGYYVNNGHPHWQETLNFLDLIAKWRSTLNVKTPSKRKRKRNVNSQSNTNDNLDQVEYLFSKFFNWFCESQASGSNGLSDETFKTFKQTSRALPLLARYLIEEKCLEYVEYVER